MRLVRYAKRINIHSVSAGWDGALPPGSRFKLSEAFGRKISYSAWIAFQSVMRRYAIGLDFELNAATITEAKAASKAVLKATNELLAAIAVANEERMDRLISNRAAEKWETVHDHGFIFDFDQERMVADIAARVTNLEEDPLPDWATDLGWELVRGWNGAGRLVRPAPAADFVVALHEFQQAFGLVAKDLAQEGKEAIPRVPAWMQFVVDVREWAKSNGFPAWAGNNDAHGDRPHGPLVYFIKGVNDLLPDRYRRPPIKDISWSSSIQEAWSEYQAGAAKLAGLSGQKP